MSLRQYKMKTVCCDHFWHPVPFQLVGIFYKTIFWIAKVFFLELGEFLSLLEQKEKGFTFPGRQR